MRFIQMYHPTAPTSLAPSTDIAYNTVWKAKGWLLVPEDQPETVDAAGDGSSQTEEDSP